jgi:hypothetical protein
MFTRIVELTTKPGKHKQLSESEQTDSFPCSFCIPYTITLVPFLADFTREYESSTFNLQRKDRLCKSVPSSHERPTNNSRKIFIASATSQHYSTLGQRKPCHQICESGGYSGTQVELCSGMNYSRLQYSLKWLILNRLLVRRLHRQGPQLRPVNQPYRNQ